ncbi:MAG: hypothetical protein Q8O19_06245 [Rectinemataceae bacterium]|nr:hypothetical protein [Rectinemataceae bacterium]
MNKLLLAPVLALAVLSMGAASAAPAISPSSAVRTDAPKLTATKVRQVLVYRCWTYNTIGQTWWGQHQRLSTARRLAMTACVRNTPYGQMCYHSTDPCEELYL